MTPTGSPTVRTPRRTMLICTLLAFAMFAVPLSQFVVDDAFISFRYARNLARGHGLTYNPGERVEGYSNLLWVLLVAPCHTVGIDALLWARLLGFACTLLVILTVVKLPTACARPKDVIGCIAPALLCTNCSFVLWTFGGMETALFALLVTWGCFLYARGRASASVGAFVLASLTRPEGALLLALTMAHYVVTQHFGCASGRRGRAWATCACGTVLLGVYAIWRQRYYGDWLPNTFHAKSGATLAHVLQGSEYLQDFCMTYFHPLLLLLPVVTIFASPGAARWASHMLCMIVAAAFFALYAGGDWMPAHRFIVPVLPIAYFLVQEGARDLLRCMSPVTGRPKAAGIAAVGVVVLLFQNALTFADARHQARRFATENAYGASVGRWLRARAGEGASLAVCDAGILPYVTDFHTIDRRGLMDRHIARLRGETFMDKCDPDYVLDRKPTFIEAQISLRAPLDTPDGSAPLSMPGIPRSALRVVPRDRAISWLAKHARWLGGSKLYANPRFTAHYRPLVIYRVGDLWHVAIFERRAP